MKGKNIEIMLSLILIELEIISSYVSHEALGDTDDLSLAQHIMRLQGQQKEMAEKLRKEKTK